MTDEKNKKQKEKRTTVSLTESTLKRMDMFAWYASEVLQKRQRSVSINELELVICDLAQKELNRINKIRYEERLKEKDKDNVESKTKGSSLPAKPDRS